MLWDTLLHIAQLLGADRAHLLDGEFHFDLDSMGDWTLAVSPDSAGRVRMRTCHLGVERDTKWTVADYGRMTRIVREALDEAAATVTT